MKWRLIMALVVMAALVVPTVAQAETYSANNLSNGVNSVCTNTYGHAWYGQYFGLSNINCSNIAPITVTCTATNGGVTTTNGPRTTSCATNAVGNYWAFSTARSRIALPSGFLWAGQPGFYSGNQDASTSYTCEIGTDRRVKVCTFTDYDL